jgi:hypothetical protein
MECASFYLYKHTLPPFWLTHTHNTKHRNYHVTLTHEYLSFGYSASCGRRKVDRSQIRSVEVIEHINGLCEWGGYGIRKQLPSWETGYIARNGPGVRMIYLDSSDGNKEKAVTFSCFDPETLVNLLT